jgi:IS1 family transposase
MNKLSIERKVQAVACLLEGNSLCSAVRETGIHRTTIQNLLVDLGTACSAFQDETLRNLTCKRIQCDEIWSFVYAEENVPSVMKDHGAGDIWTWTAIDPDTKLAPCWFVGNRDAMSAYHFIYDLKDRFAHRVQLTTDGLRTYLQATEDAFGGEIDYAELIKIYGTQVGPSVSAQVRYTPAQCMGASKAIVTGSPEHAYISTTHVERQNLTMRMSLRRFTRLTSGFSKKVENHEAAIALHFMYYNFGRVYQASRVTPAMEAGISDHVWKIEEIVRLLD